MIQNIEKALRKYWGYEGFLPLQKQPAMRPVKTPKATKDSLEGVDRGLFEALRMLRREIADKKGVSAFGDVSEVFIRSPSL